MGGVRRRSARMVSERQPRPDREWSRTALVDVGRAHCNPRIIVRKLRIGEDPPDLRQIAIKDPGHPKLTLLLAKQLVEPAASFVDRYARGMLIEDAIAGAIEFFHMDTPSAAVPMRIDLDIQLTLMASGFYRVLATRLGKGFENARAQTLFRDFVRVGARIRVTEKEVIVGFGRRAHSPSLLAADFARKSAPIHWLRDRSLQPQFT